MGKSNGELPATTETRFYYSFQLKPREYPWSFESAVQYAQGRIKKSGHLTDEKRWKLYPEKGIERIKKDPKGLIKEAEEQIEAFEQLRLGIALQLEYDHSLTEDIKQWIINYFRDEVTKPERKSGAPTKDGNNILVLRMVEEIARTCKLKHSRNIEPSKKAKKANPTYSACDVVAESFRRLGMTPNSFNGVNNLWKKRKSTHPELYQDDV